MVLVCYESKDQDCYIPPSGDDRLIPKNKYYQQKRGGAMGSAFTQVFANIYMLEWEQDLIKHQASKHEIYGRFV